LACRYDELSADIALNQIMKAAVTKLAKVARAPENQRRLAGAWLCLRRHHRAARQSPSVAPVDDPTYGVGQADVYQMMAYAHVYRCERLLLLYPHHAGVGSEPAGLTCVHRINGTDDSRIGVATLSLSNPRAVGQLRELLLVEGLALHPRQFAAA
jgi:5-methylcytosine-specific restriction endonuclease McrBC regulatory subunit McrC